MADLPSVDELVKTLSLQPHPEGGFFRETYRSSGLIPAASLPAGFGGDRNFSTAIYFLLPKGTRSRLHRIKSDEIWYYHLGGAATIVSIDAAGAVEKIVLGPGVGSGQKLQHVVPAGRWFGASPDPLAAYSLVGCSVAPGFDFADFELGRRDELLKAFPGAREDVERLAG